MFQYLVPVRRRIDRRLPSIFIQGNRLNHVSYNCPASINNHCVFEATPYNLILYLKFTANISPAASNVASMSTANYTPPDNDNNFMYAEPPQSHYIPPHMNVMPHIHYQQYPVRNDAVHNDQFSAQYKPYYANAGEYAFGDQRRYDPSAHMPISCDNMAAMGEPGPMPKTEADNAMNTDESIEKFRSSQLMVLDQFRNEDYLTSSVERFELLC